MPLLPAPAQLTHAEKDALIASLTARLALADQRIAAQDERIAALEARLNQQTRPPKTPGQLVEAAVAGTQARACSARHGSPTTQEPPRCRADATSAPGSYD